MALPQSSAAHPHSRLNTAPRADAHRLPPASPHWSGSRPLPAVQRALLARALGQRPEFDAVLPVDADALARAWGLEAEDRSALAAEAWTWAPRLALPIDPGAGPALWRDAETAARAVAGDTAVRAALLPFIAVPGAALPPLDPGAWRPRGLATHSPPRSSAGLDGRPVILHVLHDWGGGVERFVALQARQDPDTHHLALVSGGRPHHGHGDWLSLRLATGGPAFRHWRLDPPAGDLVEHHPGIAAVLAEVIASFGVGALRVSSLIGLSLDVLRSGLPTHFVLHDLFPFWPWLDDSSPRPEVSGPALAAAMAAPDWRFATRDPARWQTLARATLRALDDTGTPLVAPSRSALARLHAVAPESTALAAQVLPHGVPPVPPRATTRAPGPLRVLVPGRLAGAKGEHLLRRLLPLAPPGLDWCFLGGGPIGAEFARCTGGRDVADYEADALDAALGDFDPDLALLPSLLPETFGFVLSEMLARGIPVLAAELGAYGERLRAAGLEALVATPEAFAHALAEAAAAPDRLPRVQPAPPDLTAAARAWAALPGPAPALGSLPPEGLVSVLQHERGILALTVSILQRERDAAYAFHARDTADLIRQRDAAVARIQDLSQELEARPRPEALAETQQQRDAAYRYYEQDTADLIRQRDVALAQRDALQEQLEQTAALLRHPLLRGPLALIRKVSDARLRLQYRWDKATDLLQRGLRSLRQRGFVATLSAVRRRWARKAADAPALAPARPTAVAFPALEQARTSIIVPVHGRLDYTLACLRSLAGCGLPEGSEVIVVDDASPDDSGEMLPRIPGLRYLRNRQNLGFVGSCNAGAAAARGDVLVFLNNDTTVRPGWLQALLATFETHPDTGLAGAKLVYPDGRLQESGGIVFADGSGWNYGRFEDPEHPAYSFVREADYCSGAAIAIPRPLFERLGGFDERYAPAYYEDTDLAMKVREAGLKVRVQPASVVVHHEGVTAGTDTGSGVKAYQVRNQQRFLERWSEALRRQPPPSQAPLYAAQHRARARVLVIDATTPMPDRDSGSLRLYELLRLLVEDGCAVTFFAENGLDDGRYSQALRDLGVETWTQPWLGQSPDWLARHGARFQLVIVSRHYVLAPLLPLLRRHAPQARIVFDTVDLHHLREQREAEERDDPALLRQAARTRESELALVRAVDRTWVVSPVEQALLASILPEATVDVVSNIHRARGLGPAMAAREGLIFVGGFRHPPNVDAALWLAEDILPRIRALRPDIGLSLVGSDAPASVLALGQREGITVHGHVPDLVPLLDRHRLSVAPLRYGAGVKGKVNQALAHGLPVVATACAIEGMGLEDGRDVRLADDAAGFAEAVLGLYDDAVLWQRLVEGGLANTAAHFSPERARRTLRQVFEQLR